MKRKKDILLVVLFALLTAGLYLLPGKYEMKDSGALRCTAVVLGTDDSAIDNYGLIRKGEQKLSMRVLTGRFKERVVSGNNELLGRMDRDKLFRKGDEVYLVLTLNSEGEIIYVNPQEHYRLGTEMLLFGLFAGLLIIFGGITGIKALLSLYLCWYVDLAGVYSGIACRGRAVMDSSGVGSGALCGDNIPGRGDYQIRVDCVCRSFSGYSY